MIEDVLIRKFVAEHHRCTRANSNPAFSIVIAHTVGLIAPVPGSRCGQSYKSCDDLDEQLETVSAQIAPGLFRSPEISLPHRIQISRSSRLDCVVWYFYYGQAIENTGAAKH
jgi:hypothetical protein